MENLKEEINKIRILLKSTESDLDEITKDSFNIKMAQVRSKLNLIVTKRNKLLLLYDRTELLKFDKGLFNLAKQIQKKFDNLIEQFKADSLEIAQKIVQIENKKKLANYIR